MLLGFGLVATLALAGSSAVAQQQPAQPANPSAPANPEAIPPPSGSQPAVPVQPAVPPAPEAVPNPKRDQPATPAQPTAPAQPTQPEYTPPPYWQLSATPVVPKRVERGKRFVVTFKNVRANVPWVFRAMVWTATGNQRAKASRPVLLKPGQRRTIRVYARAPKKGKSFTLTTAVSAVVEGDPVEDISVIRGTKMRTVTVRLK